MLRERSYFGTDRLEKMVELFSRVDVEIVRYLLVILIYTLLFLQYTHILIKHIQ